MPLLACWHPDLGTTVEFSSGSPRKERRRGVGKSPWVPRWKRGMGGWVEEGRTQAAGVLRGVGGGGRTHGGSVLPEQGSY